MQQYELVMGWFLVMGWLFNGVSWLWVGYAME